MRGTVSFTGWTKPVAEPEIAVHMGKDLPGGADTAPPPPRRSPRLARQSNWPTSIRRPYHAAQVTLAGCIFHCHVILGQPDPACALAELDGLVAHVFRRGALAAKQDNVEALIGEMIGIVQHVAGTLAATASSFASGMSSSPCSIVPPPFIEPDETEFAYVLEPVGGLSVKLSR